MSTEKPTFSQDRYVIYEGFRIKKIERRGQVRYQLNLGMQEGRHVRRMFGSLDKAKRAAELMRREKENYGVKALNITDAIRVDAVEALAILKGTGAGLADAAREFVKRHAPPDDALTVAGLVGAFLTWMENTKQKLSARSPGRYRPVTLADARRKLARFASDLGDMAAVQVDADTVRDWLNDEGFSPTNWDNHRRCVAMCYSWASSPRHGGPLPGCPNPAAKDACTPPAQAYKAPQIFDVKTVSQIMRWYEENAPDLVAAVAVGFFAGIRPQELLRLSWDDVDLHHGEIHIGPEVSKTHSERLVSITPNLKKWLVEYNGTGPLSPSYSTASRARAALRAQTGVEWGKDIARHSFATYYAAIHGMDATAEELGHTSTAMLHRHYKGLVKNRRSHAKAYFSIEPVQKNNVIELRRPA